MYILVVSYIQFYFIIRHVKGLVIFILMIFDHIKSIDRCIMEKKISIVSTLSIVSSISIVSIMDICTECLRLSQIDSVVDSFGSV